MTYKEYDNIFIDSGIPCPPATTICYLRNGYLFDVEMFNPIRTLTPVTGTTELIFDLDRKGQRITNFIAADNYIYFFYYGSDDWMHIVEYNKDTKIDIDLEICSGPPYGTVSGGIAYIEERKILLVSDNNDDYTGVFVIDFETEYVDRQFDMNYPITSRSIVLDEHIWLYTFGYYSTGWDIWYKDYTAGSSWTQVFIDATNNEMLNGHYPFFVGNNYLVWFTSKMSDISPFYPVVKAWAFNLSTNTSQSSDWVEAPDWNNRTWSIRSASQGVDGCAYATASGWFQTSFPPYEYFECWFKYDPTENILTIIHSYDVLSHYPLSKVLSSSNTTYIWNSSTKTFTKIVGTGSEGVYYSQYQFQAACILMDDNSERVLVCGSQGEPITQFHIISATGGTGQDIYTSYPDTWYAHHLGNAIAVTTDDGNYWQIYIVT